MSPFQSAKDASTKANNLTSHTANEVEVAGTGPSASSHEKSVIGGMPNLAADMEFVREQLALNVDLQGLHKTAQNAEIQYRKTRRPASRQSIKQAKRILDGDASKLLSALHPALAQRLPCSKQQQSAPQVRRTNAPPFLVTNAFTREKRIPVVLNDRVMCFLGMTFLQKAFLYRFFSHVTGSF